MAFKRPKNAQGTWFEQPSDPALDPNNGVDALSKWLDNSTSPATLKERNASNTAWNPVGGGSSSAQLGSYTDVVAGVAGQTSATLTYTPASKADILPIYNSIPQDNALILSLSGRTVSFPALNDGDTLALRYTRLD